MLSQNGRYSTLKLLWVNNPEICNIINLWRARKVLARHMLCLVVFASWRYQEVWDFASGQKNCICVLWMTSRSTYEKMVKLISLGIVTTDPCFQIWHSCLICKLMYLIYSGVCTSAYGLVSGEIRYFQTVAAYNLKKYLTRPTTDFQGDAARFPDTITAQRGEWL